MWRRLFRSDLRTRVLAAVVQGAAGHEAAVHFGISAASDIATMPIIGHRGHPPVEVSLY